MNLEGEENLWDKVLTSIPFIFVLSLVIGLIFYGISNRIAPKGKKTPGKLAPYACGEDVPPIRLQVNVERFFLYAVFFMIFDILAVVMATSLARPGILPAIYALIVLSSVVLLVPLARW